MGPYHFSNREDLYHSGPNPERIRTYTIPCKHSPSHVICKGQKMTGLIALMLPLLEVSDLSLLSNDCLLLLLCVELLTSLNNVGL